MGFLYPDNKNRASRVNQLCSDTAHLQTQIKEAIEDAKTQDKRAVEILDKIAKQRGYRTLNEYLEDARKKLSPEDRKKYEDLKRELEAKDEGLDIAMKLATGVAGIGFLCKAGPILIKVIFNRNLVNIALRAVGVALLRIITGNLSEGQALLSSISKFLSSALKTENLTSKFAVSMIKYLKVAGKVLTILGVAFDAVFLIYEIVDGAKQRAEFQKAIKDLCVRRFSVKKIQQYTRVTLSFASDGSTIASLAQTLQEVVNSGTLTQEQADEAVAKKMRELEPKITKAIDDVNDNSVHKMLAEQDKESNIAWTNEDPSLLEILKMLEEDKNDKSKE
ncbi:hypothetical protein PNOK_0000900 [Pyrrhoderma noxium]|uniref:Uncharacterized protein n=1 Tax=Pyrrhoderma noxium TaxID=2282107 RepID=A0A286UTV6_9AGAM|nr:hypothetical protein PNOK_0000900 [Pyrrhoderma noxium]